MSNQGVPVDADAQAVITQLEDKLGALSDAGSELNMAFAEADTDQRVLLRNEMEAVSNEEEACQDRIEDLRAQQPFTRPDAAAEQALLNAINAVGALVNASAAVDAVLTAADNLVKAYTAKSTQATPGG